jgi:cathepsin F
MSDEHFTDFFEFVQKFEKEYINDEVEFAQRFNIFKSNLNAIKVMQKLETGTATYGITQFADMTPEEFSKFYLSPAWPQQHPVPMKMADLTNLQAAPTSFDWRTKGAVTPVKNQGQCGSCWSFSTTGNVEGQWQIKKGKLISLSEQELVDCDKVDQGCEGGLPSQAYQQIMKLGGLTTESNYPYTAADGKTCKFNKNSAVVYINSSVALPTDENQLAAWLAQNGPISIGINAGPMQWYTGGVASPMKFLCNPNKLDHGVLIVGYDTSASTPYWIIKNSWGTTWGESGYYRVKFGSGVCGLNTMCTSAVIN